VNATSERAWWRGLPPARTTLACGDHVHRLRWEAGALHAVDHPEAEDERTLAALGGERVACIDVLDAWACHAEDLRALVLASRGPSDRFAVPAEPSMIPSAGLRAAGAVVARRMAMQRRGWSAYAPRISVSSGGPGTISDEQPTSVEQLVMLVRLGGGLPERLVAGVAAAWSARLARGEAIGAGDRAQLAAALYGRVAAAITAWLGEPGADVEVRMIGEGEPARLESGDGGVVLAALPVSWLVDVWASGLATVWNRFCLSAASMDGSRWTLSTVTRDLGPPEPLVLELPS